MASTKKKKSTAATASPASGNGGGGDDAVHTETTVTMMSFANPPSAQSPATVAQACAKSGFSSIGISASGSAQIIDFSLIDDGMCQTLGSSIEVCVAAGGFPIPGLTATFMIMQRRGTQFTFANFVSALAEVMVPKS